MRAATNLQNRRTERALQFKAWQSACIFSEHVLLFEALGAKPNAPKPRDILRLRLRLRMSTRPWALASDFVKKYGGGFLTQPPPRGLPLGNGPTAFYMLYVEDAVRKFGLFLLGVLCLAGCLLVSAVSGSFLAFGTGEELGLHLSGVVASCLASC